MNICDDYTREYSPIFNGKNSKCILFPGSEDVGHRTTAHVLPSLQAGGIDIEYVDSWTYSGHILSSDFQYNMDIEYRRVQAVKQINDMLQILEN